jgi:hypothetical protein
MATQVDHAEIKLGQILTMLIATAGLVLRDPLWLVALGGIFLLTVLYRPVSPFVATYRLLVRPLGIMRSDYRLDNIEAHAFGQAVGAVTVALALALLYSGYAVVGWMIVAILIGLTLVSYLGWCIGCFLYYQLNRLGLRGFFARAPTDKSIFPGRRPRKQP